MSDIHCVTTWSRYDNQWKGLPTRRTARCLSAAENARFVVLHSYDGYTTNLALEDFAAEDALLAHSWSGQPLERGAWRPGAAGGAASLFLEEREMAAGDRVRRHEDAPGYWEVRGYHNRGDPWAEQRYSDD